MDNVMMATQFCLPLVVLIDILTNSGQYVIFIANKGLISWLIKDDPWLCSGVDLEPDFLGVSRTTKLENLEVRQKFWESAIFLKYNIIYSWVKLKPSSSHSSKSVLWPLLRSR